VSMEIIRSLGATGEMSKVLFSIVQDVGD